MAVAGLHAGEGSVAVVAAGRRGWAARAPSGREFCEAAAEIATKRAAGAALDGCERAAIPGLRSSEVQAAAAVRERWVCTVQACFEQESQEIAAGGEAGGACAERRGRMRHA